MRLTRPRQLAFLEDLALALADGLSPLQACYGLAEHAREQGLTAEQRLAADLIQALNAGQALGSVLELWFDRDLCMLVSVGESSGVLEQLLQQQRRFEEQRQQAQRAFWRPLIYPAIMTVIAVLASLVIGRKVLPKLAGRLPEDDWPAVSKTLLTLSDGPLLLALLLLVVLMLFWSWGPASLINFRFRAWRVLAARGAFMIRRYFDAVIILQTVTVLLNAGINLDRALVAINRYGSPGFGYAVHLMRQRLAAGERRLAQIFDCGLLSPRMLFRLSNGSRNATEHGTLQRVAGYATDDAVAALGRLRVTLQIVCYGLIFMLLALLLGGMGAMLMAVTQQTMI
ncbi:hypothetical protein IDSA_01865 [Pseudidiomarina salinarum]|uniref:Type II secretion system protein GspF domain-containing protein n=1 Tax=Pseudidiomarina salinarum TaxID=435908 RepID=A0A094JFZ8_9GAMM|nr:type II secretion system F family protein [Pseudidiomarina salinarum]KFZ31486.1 hypothetical protein IDSA_01865 [Pseudidiomarina salinarum]RUO70752.1 hypothetical protein CWI79_04705 [Pseudidiomarina salinarum]